MKVALDVGFERYELNADIQNVDLANGQQHVANIRRLNKGRILEIAVSRHSTPASYAYGIVPRARWIYLGTSHAIKARPGWRDVCRDKSISHEEQCHMHFLARQHHLVNYFQF